MIIQLTSLKICKLFKKGINLHFKLILISDLLKNNENGVNVEDKEMTNFELMLMREDKKPREEII